MAQDLRFFARWAPWPSTVLGACVTLAIFQQIWRGASVPAIISLTSTALIQFGVAWFIRFIRPLILANADRWEAEEEMS